LTELQSKLNKPGFTSIVFDGQYEFARYYAPANFETPTTLEQTMRDNDVQLFDLLSDPLETHNLALGPEKNEDLILRMNALLNELLPMKWAGTTGVFCRRRSAQSLSEPSGHVLCRHEMVDLPRCVCCKIDGYMKNAVPGRPGTRAPSRKGRAASVASSTRGRCGQPPMRSARCPSNDVDLPLAELNSSPHARIPCMRHRAPTTNRACTQTAAGDSLPIRDWTDCG
jgi:hypothetical protein